MGGGAVGKVLHPRHLDFAGGEYVVGMFGWRQYAISDGAGVMKVDPRVAPISTSLGVLGMPGLTVRTGLGVLEPVVEYSMAVTVRRR